MTKIKEIISNDGDKDLSNERIVILEDGGKLHVKRHDPYGFWRINWDSGRLPAVLDQQYTEFAYALKEIEKYLTTANRTVERKPLPVPANTRVIL